MAETSKMLCKHFEQLPIGVTLTATAGPFTCPWCELDLWRREVSRLRGIASTCIAYESTARQMHRALEQIAGECGAEHSESETKVNGPCPQCGTQWTDVRIMTPVPCKCRAAEKASGEPFRSRISLEKLTDLKHRYGPGAARARVMPSGSHAYCCCCGARVTQIREYFGWQLCETCDAASNPGSPSKTSDE